MVRPRLDTERPRCPHGHDGDVLLAGRRVWTGGVFCRSRFICVPKRGERHKFSVPRRQPTGTHPHGDTCPSCDARAGRTGGPITVVDHRFSAAEIAALLIRLGRGSSLREASQAARLDAQRHVTDQFGTRHASRQGGPRRRLPRRLRRGDRRGGQPAGLAAILISKPLGMRAYQADAWGIESQFRAGALLMAVGKQQPGERARC